MRRIDCATIFAWLAPLASNCALPVRFASLAVLVTVSSVTTDQALAQTDADFSAYCRKNFPNSAYQRIPQSWGTEHACNQGGTRQRIDLDEACRLTTGNREHKEMGTRVICQGSAGGAAADNAQDAGPLDLVAYCRQTFPNSMYEHRSGPTGVEHYCRQTGTTGGFTLQKADLAAACRSQQDTDSFRKSGVQVICVNEGGSQAANTSNTNNSSSASSSDDRPDDDQPPKGGPDDAADKPEKLTKADIERIRKREFAPLKPEDVINAGGSGDLTNKNVKFANLKDCGGGDPKTLIWSVNDFQRVNMSPDGLDGMGWPGLGMATPCPGLTGGRKLNILDYCRTLSSPDIEWQIRRTASGRPVCWRPGRGRFEDIPARGLVLAETHGDVGFACIKVLQLKSGLPRGAKGREYRVLYKYFLKEDKVECFFIKQDELFRTLKRG